jgi:hypothetical protein
MKIEHIAGYIEFEDCERVVLMDRFSFLGLGGGTDREQISQMQSLGYTLFFESATKRIWIKLKQNSAEDKNEKQKTNQN